MPDASARGIPILTRDELDFGRSAAFALSIYSQSFVSTKITIRGITKSGPFTFVHTPNSDASVKTEVFGLTDIPIWVSAVTTDATVVRGDTYVRISLAINGDISTPLAAGYCYGAIGPAWPNTQLVEPGPLGGHVIDTAGTNPAAGAEINDLVPANSLWLLKGIRAQLVTDGTATNRRVHIAILRGSTPLDFHSETNQTATQTINYTFVNINNATSDADDNDQNISIPKDIELHSGDQITTITTNLQAGDNWGAPSYIVERFPYPA